MKVPRCEKVQIHRPGDANLTCVKPAGHEGACEVVEVCPHCHGSGRTGKVVAAPATDYQAIAKREAAA